MSYDNSDCIQERDGFKLCIAQDEDAENPREWDDIGTLVTTPRNRYLSSDKNAPTLDSELLEQWSEDGAYVWPIGAYVHSGMTVWLGSLRERSAGVSAFDSAGWDSGTIGFYMIPKDRSAQEWKDDPDKGAQAWAKACIGTLDEYVQGDVWYYTVLDPEGNVLDSCSGIFGRDYAEKEAREAFEHYVTKESDAALDYACRC